MAYLPNIMESSIFKVLLEKFWRYTFFVKALFVFFIIPKGDFFFNTDINKFAHKQCILKEWLEALYDAS